MITDAKRITRDELYIEIANSFSKRGSCGRLQVGAVIVRQGRIICTGYNGPLKSNRIDDPFIKKDKGLCNCDLSSPCEKAIHAEANAIAFAAKNGIKLNGSRLYVTHSPCLKCSELIIQAGIREVIYDRKFRDEAGINLLKSNNIQCSEY